LEHLTVKLPSGLRPWLKFLNWPAQSAPLGVLVRSTVLEGRRKGVGVRGKRPEHWAL
jgi:hypothetical protein